MGVWGAGLYSGDFAADLRSTVAAVIRLPFEVNRLVEILCEIVPDIANNPEDPEHTIFWLVLADQFSQQNMVSDQIRETALTIIDSGQDISIHETLGMPAVSLIKRRKTLEELRVRLVSPSGEFKIRKTLKQPQPLLMDVGDLLVYPTCRGEGINPFFQENAWSEASGWKGDGWGALLIIDAGRVFDFLAWYRPLTLVAAQPEKPNLERLLSQREWVQRNPGICSASHFKRMQFEKIHRIAIDDSRRRQCFPNLSPGMSAAIQEICISNELGIAPDYNAFFRMQLQPNGEFTRVPFPSIGSLMAITDATSASEPRHRND